MAADYYIQMRNEDAVEMVMSLARSNVIDFQDTHREDGTCIDVPLENERQKQVAAIAIMEDFFSNVVFR